MLKNVWFQVLKQQFDKVEEQLKEADFIPLPLKGIRICFIKVKDNVINMYQK